MGIASARGWGRAASTAFRTQLAAAADRSTNALTYVLCVCVCNDYMNLCTQVCQRVCVHLSRSVNTTWQLNNYLGAKAAAVPTGRIRNKYLWSVCKLVGNSQKLFP